MELVLEELRQRSNEALLLRMELKSRDIELMNRNNEIKDCTEQLGLRSREASFLQAELQNRDGQLKDSDKELQFISVQLNSRTEELHRVYDSKEELQNKFNKIFEENIAFRVRIAELEAIIKGPNQKVGLNLIEKSNQIINSPTSLSIQSKKEHKSSGKNSHIGSQIIEQKAVSDKQVQREPSLSDLDMEDLEKRMQLREEAPIGAPSTKDKKTTGSKFTEFMKKMEASKIPKTNVRDEEAISKQNSIRKISE